MSPKRKATATTPSDVDGPGLKRRRIPVSESVSLQLVVIELARVRCMFGIEELLRSEGSA